MRLQQPYPHVTARCLGRDVVRIRRRINPRVFAAHSAATAQHRSPPPLIALIHGIFGGPPSLGPASSPDWHDLMQARRLLTAQEDARGTPGKAFAARRRPRCTRTFRDSLRGEPGELLSRVADLIFDRRHFLREVINRDFEAWRNELASVLRLFDLITVGV
jgi:hypothetical protein